MCFFFSENESSGILRILFTIVDLMEIFPKKGLENSFLKFLQINLKSIN